MTAAIETLEFRRPENEQISTRKLNDVVWYVRASYTVTTSPNIVALAALPVTASRLLGRGAGGGDGVPQEIAIGTNLSLSGTTLNGPPGAALTRVNDTNVTLTLGGTPATALLVAASITVGWNGQLAVSRGGTGVSTLGDITRTNDTNVTLTLGGTPTGSVVNSVSFTLGWSGTLAGSRGGTGSAFFTVSGPTSARTFTFPDASDTVACLGQVNAFTARMTITSSAAGASALVVTGNSGARIIADNAGGGSHILDATSIVFRATGGGTTFLTINSSAVNSTVPFQRGGTQVVNTRRTGWTAATGTAARGTFATYTAPTISNPPTQAEVQAIADALQIVSQHQKAMIDDLIAHGLIGT